ncbi:hypothetical protein PROFUN_08349 [Planoprotostelium fungivorum]|uniref:Uracil-DNA glycosylase n=1 Tax=Planoprotostelium fungivorum TaxID=1890364 RepID=A0A2P6NI34_9EUKA|nr:hypothetical protein PROFUN_08349 [Planoprotostelium fungivorum]
MISLLRTRSISTLQRLKSLPEQQRHRITLSRQLTTTSMPKKKLEETAQEAPAKKQRGLDAFIIKKTPEKKTEETNGGKEEEKEPTIVESTGTLFDHLKDPHWRAALADEVQKPYFKKLISQIEQEKKDGKEIFPPEEDIFAAMNLTPLKDVKVVIIGQDPYHDNNQAHGLSFSVRKGITVPPSLRNIYKELSTDIPDFKIPKSGDLTQWAERGVLLLNASLTVRAHEANSHSKYGWLTFTDAIIRIVNEKKSGVVFLLWGGFAQKKGANINRSKHAVIEAAHPSPLSVKKWWGCKCFSKTNKELEKFGEEPIDWTIRED